MRTLIKNGRVVTAVDDYKADIFIDGETVTTIGKTLNTEADVVIGRVWEAETGVKISRRFVFALKFGC